MFAMALGMGVILIAIGVGAGFLLPKAGTWMTKVKHVFGVMLLGVAIYLLGILPQVPVLLLWAMLFIVSGVYLGATQSLPAGANGWQYLWKGFGTVLLIWGVLALLGGFAGNRDFMNPLPMSSLGVTAGVPARDARHRRASVRAREEPARTGGPARRGQGRGQTGYDRLLRRLVHRLSAHGESDLRHAPGARRNDRSFHADPD